MRIALLTYRGNMYCGGQGIYAAYLAREWQKAGHDVHVIAGPPLPELAPGIPLHVIPNENVSDVKHRTGRAAKIARAVEAALAVGAGRVALRCLPEMQTFGLRLMLRCASSTSATASTWSSTTRACPGDCSNPRHGVPVVSVIHHPLHIDREARLRDRSAACQEESSARCISPC